MVQWEREREYDRLFEWLERELVWERVRDRDDEDDEVDVDDGETSYRNLFARFEWPRPRPRPRFLEVPS